MILASLLLAAVIPLTEVLDGLHDYEDGVELEATVSDVFADPLGGDPLNYFLILAEGEKSIYLPMTADKLAGESPFSLVGSRIWVKGVACFGSRQPNRRYSGRLFACTAPGDFKVVERGSADPFDVLPLPDLSRIAPTDLPSLGRRRATGRVLAVWGGDNLLIAVSSNEVMRVSLVRAAPPRCGETVDVVGIPETDTYRLHLSRAAWRPSSVQIGYDESAEPVTARDLTIWRYGRVVRIEGRIRKTADAGERLVIESDGHLIPVETDALASELGRFEKDAMVEVTGVCVFLIAPWRQTAPFPKFDGVVIVPRSTGDVRILATPPWWTPARFIVVLAILFALLVGIFIWNRALQALANRRGRELMRERLGAVRSKLQVIERTRLAVELHDTLSQTLAGVAMQIETAQQFPDGASPELLKHLDVADRALDSCREELRNCLYDLRSDTLNEKDMSEAIRKTLLPHCANVELVIRFNVSRRLLSDKTVHSLLQIIRELALNGIRHGGATRIKVAGTYENGKLLFSVADNGRGFDPDTRPGVAQGHFGLQGVRERVGSLNGRFKIESAPGEGAKATISISADDENEER